MRRGFTLLELIVVSTLLALVAAMVVPRLAGMSRREADVATERMAELLSMFAWRDNTGVQQSAIWMNPDSGCVELWTQESDPDRPTDHPQWVPDRHVQPVRLPAGVQLEDVRADGQSLAGDEWRIVGTPGGQRPRIEMRIVADGFESVLVLEPGAGMPTRVDNGVVREGARATKDLDRSGLDREPW
jgi:prepilin-type N-terminal cleavage/methylation domain-containing protein